MSRKHFVVFSDLHLHQWQYGSHVINGRNSRLEQQVQTVQSISAFCRDRDISEVVFCGDLFHSATVTPEVSQAAYQAFKGFKENNITLTIVVGNHDQGNRSGGIHALEWLRDHGRVVGQTMVWDDTRSPGGLYSYFFPYTEDAETLKGWIKEVKQEGALLFFHQGVGGVEVNSKGFTLNEILSPAMVPGHAAMAFSGHYHSNKSVSGNLVIPGSTTQLNWGDEGEHRGWLDVTVDGGQVTNIDFIDSGASKFVTVHEEEFDNHDEDTPLSDLVGNFVRVISNGAFSPEELSSTVLKMGAASCEIKPIYKENVITKINTVQVASLNEVIYSFANAKEKAGSISAHDKDVGERLLKHSYFIPQI